LSHLRASAFTATRTLDPDIEIAAISGRSVKPHGSKTPGRDLQGELRLAARFGFEPARV
jgi:hypothetical protein